MSDVTYRVERNGVVVWPPAVAQADGDSGPWSPIDGRRAFVEFGERLRAQTEAGMVRIRGYGYFEYDEL